MTFSPFDSDATTNTAVPPTLTLAAYMPENRYYTSSPDDNNQIVNTGKSFVWRSYQSDFQIWNHSGVSKHVSANYYDIGPCNDDLPVQEWFFENTNCTTLANDCNTLFYSYGEWEYYEDIDIFWFFWRQHNNNKKYYLNKYSLGDHATHDNDHRSFYFEKKYFTILGKIWDDPYIRPHDNFALRNNHKDDHYYLKDDEDRDDAPGSNNNYHNLNFRKENSNSQKGTGKYDTASWFQIISFDQ